TFKDFKSANFVLAGAFAVGWVMIIWMLVREFSVDNAEIPASWFQILHAFFIITLAPVFSKFWENVSLSGPLQLATGLFLVGLGFAFLALGSKSIPSGAESASVSMMWLVLAYLLHSMGELCVSPVGLSYVSKLAPLRLVGLMFGIWFIANFIANLSAGF